MAVIALGDVLFTGEAGFHRSQEFTVIVHEQVQRAQHIIMWILLSELAERRLEVVVLHGHVVVVRSPCALHLVEPRQPVGVGAAVVHVVAQQVRARAEFHQRHRIGILGIEVGTAVVGGHHAATQLTGEVRVRGDLTPTPNPSRGEGGLISF